MFDSVGTVLTTVLKGLEREKHIDLSEIQEFGHTRADEKSEKARVRSMLLFRQHMLEVKELGGPLPSPE